MGWALAYWNGRKSAFVLRGRKGRCPCHNPSDSGRPMETGCDAILDWAQPRRFRRVCPLLAVNERGAWVCSVDASKVRPFWGRAAAYVAALLLSLAILAGGAAFGTMRLIGYRVSLRQVFWPPAWREVAGVRAQLFVGQAQAHYQAGRMREAVSALATAHEIAPRDYAIAMTLAQVMQVANPGAADSLYLQMLKEHPEHRLDTARAWMLTLLGRGHLADAAELAVRELPVDQAQEVVWTHALVFCARHLRRPELLEAAAATAGVGAGPAAVLRLEARVRRAQPAEVPALLLGEPLPPNFSYAIEHRTELLTEFGRTREALAVLAQTRGVLAGREVAALALAAYAAAGDTATLEREGGSLLDPARHPGFGEITLLGQQLIRHPDPVLLGRVAAFLERSTLPVEQRREAWFTVLCAAGAAGDRTLFLRLRGEATNAGALNPQIGDRMQEFFFSGPSSPHRLDAFLPSAEQMSVSLVYALLDRYWRPEDGPAKAG